MRKRVISTLLAMATTAGLFAGNVSAVYAEGKSSGDYEYQELEDAEITYYNYSVEGKELYEKEIAAYNEVHPNVKINLELVGGGTDWRSTLKAEISSGQAPDLVVMEGASDFDTFGDMIEDLSDQPWVEHIYENNVSDCKVGDAIVGAPSGVVCYGLLYNKAVFEACGIDGSTLKSYDDIDAAFGKVQDAIDADKPEALVGVDYDSAMGGSFCIGKTAVIQMGQWVAPVIDEIDPELRENIGVLPMPLKGVDEDNICYGIASYFVVNKNSDDAKKAAAKDFVNWLLMSDEGKALITSNISLPFDNFADFPSENVISLACEPYAKEGNTFSLVFGGYPDGWSDLLGAGIQSYIAGEKEWDAVVEEAKANWAEMR